MTSPHRLSASNVRRFEQVIRKLVETGGQQQLCIDPAALGLRPTSCSARLSDALLSLLDNHTTLPSLDVGRLRLARSLVYISTLDSGLVCLVPRTNKQTTVAPLTVDVVTSQQGTADLCVLNTTSEQFDSFLHALALLLGSRVLSGRVRIRGTVSDALEQEITEKYDVAIVPDGGDWIML